MSVSPVEDWMMMACGQVYSWLRATTGRESASRISRAKTSRWIKNKSTPDRSRKGGGIVGGGVWAAGLGTLEILTDFKKKIGVNEH